MKRSDTYNEAHRRAVRRGLAVALLTLLLAPLLPGDVSAQGRRGRRDQPKPGKEMVETVDAPRIGDGYDLPTWQRVVLPNGLVILLMEQHESPIVNLNATIRSGSADDPKGKEGVSSLTASLLTQGTTTRSAEQVATEVDFVGGELGAATGVDTTTLESEFVSKHVDRQIELLADVLLNPAFAAGEVDRVKQQTAAELAALPENPRLYSSLQFEAAVFEGSAYGHPSIGYRRSVEALTREDVQNFYRAKYAPNNTVLAVVGDFDSKAMLEKLRAAFGGWASREVAHEPFGTPKAISGRRVVLVDFPGQNQTQIRIGAVGIARNDPDYYAVQVANVALGAGFTSRLVDEIRVNRSLSYSAGSRFSTTVRPGSFLIGTFTKNATTRETIDVALEVLGKFRNEPMPEAELTKSKNYLLGTFPLSFETPGGLADMLTTIEMNGLPRDYVETFEQKVRALTPAEVSAAIREHFDYDDLIILVFTTSSETRSQLEGLGPIDVRNYLE